MILSSTLNGWCVLGALLFFSVLCLWYLSDFVICFAGTVVICKWLPLFLFSTWYSRSKVKLVIQLFIMNVYNPHCRRGSALLILSVNQQAFPACYTTAGGLPHLPVCSATVLIVLLSVLLFPNSFILSTYTYTISMWTHIQSHSPGPDKTLFYWLLILPLNKKGFLHLDCVRGRDPCWPGLAQAPAAISWAAKYSLCPG